MKTHELSCDILVAGGGAAGLPCALAAARRGASVVLCQDRPVLGGNASSEVRMHIVGANAPGRLDRGAELETEAREGGLIEEIRLDNCVQNPQRSASMFDLILYDKCRREPHLTLLLNTAVTAAHRTGSRIERVVAERPSTEERFLIEARIFIDCTGDGRLGAEAEAAFMEGREDSAAFGEQLAPDCGDRQRLGSTILLQARRHERPMPFQAPPWARKFTADDLRLRLYATPGEEEPTHEYGYWWAEWGGVLDTIRDNERIRDELLAIALGIWDHVKNGPADGRPAPRRFGAEHWALDWIGFLPGKRESRRFIGQHVLTERDLLHSRRFDDAIAFGGWPLDLHPPEGIDAVDLEPCQQQETPHLYDIPLRCCLARDIENLMFAGRNISATHVAFSSTRVMATCAAVGQGVGTAAACAAAAGLSPSQLPHDTRTLQRVQQALLQDDAFLLGRSNQDPLDLARMAKVSASSEAPGGAAANVLSAATRAVHGSRGAPPDRRVPGTHRWMSQQGDDEPWLELRWPRPQSIGAVQLVFDTGLHRHLTLSHHDGYTRRMQWGRPQPETVKDYQVQATDHDGQWRPLAVVRNNYQRLRRHSLSSPCRADRLRIVVEATNGLDHARVMEVRVYAESHGADQSAAGR